MNEAHVDALRSSAARLRDVASTLDESDLARPAYPAEWSVAQVLSHLGSGAVIMRRGLEDALAGRTTPDGFAPEVWDAWNAKPPAAQREDALAADAALLAAIEATTPAERSGVSMPLGQMQLSFTQVVAMRLNEHAFHTWDIEVVGDPSAALPEPVAALVVDNLDLVARFTAKPTGDTTTVTVATVRPNRGFTVDLTADNVTFQAAPASSDADIELPAEAFARLVYGRLDAAHTPGDPNPEALETLRRVFPGP